MTSATDRLSWRAPGLVQAPAPRTVYRTPRLPIQTAAVWVCRALMIVPVLFMVPELLSLALGHPDAVEHAAESTADVLGTSSLVLMLLTLCVTPVQTMTGWTWHLVLRRDFGIAMFATSVLDLFLAATTTDEEFPGGLATRVGGRSFLLAGTFAVLLLAPLAVTSTKRAHRWLGNYWKRLHKLMYVIWAVVLLHLLLLFGFTGVAVDALVVSVPLVLLRLPPVRRRWATARRARRYRIGRIGAAVALVATVVYGMAPMVQTVVVKGQEAFVQRPVED